MAKQEKLKNYEISALSHKVFEEVKAIKLAKARESKEKVIKEYVTALDKLVKQGKEIEKAKQKLSDDFKKKHKVTLGYYNVTLENSILRFADFPQSYDIEREIVLKGIFSDKSELEEFIKELVKKFS